MQILQINYEGGLKSFERQHEDCFISFRHSSTTIVDTLEDTSENSRHFGLSIVPRQSFMSQRISEFS